MSSFSSIFKLIGSDELYKIALQKSCDENLIILLVIQGWIQRFLKGWAPYVGHRGWPAKKILGFGWSKKAEVTLETISFWQNIFISIFKFSPFLSIKSFQFFKISHTAVNEKRKTEKSWTCVITGCFIKLFKMIRNHFFFKFLKLIHSAIMAF